MAEGVNMHREGTTEQEYRSGIATLEGSDEAWGAQGPFCGQELQGDALGQGLNEWPGV